MTDSRTAHETPPVTGPWPAREDEPLVAAVKDGSPLRNQLYVRYRRPLLQIIYHRRVPREAAEDILQRTFEQGIKKIRAGMEDPSNLGGYLYRTACNLVTRYWQGKLSRNYETEARVLNALPDEALALEERIDQEQLAQHVRALVQSLPVKRDREVLERFYLHEEPRESVRAAFELTDLQLNQVLWRARQRFADLLRRRGLSEGYE